MKNIDVLSVRCREFEAATTEMLHTYKTINLMQS